MAPNGTAGARPASAGAPTAFGPAASGPPSRDEAHLADGPEVVPPRGSRRWWPDENIRPPSERVRREVHSLVLRKPAPNPFSDWQMSFPYDLPSGSRNPVCALGECGDVNCPAYRPKHPEVREAVEKTILEKCLAHFTGGAELRTYASVGSGLLAQDWLVLERLRESGLCPRRAIFVDLRTARPVVTCEGGEFPRPTANGGTDLRQTGFSGPLGPEFSFAADIRFDEQRRPSVLFDFCNGPGDDAIFVEVGGPEHPGLLVFGVSCGTDCRSMQIQDCWKPGAEAHKFLFTVSATGVLRVFKDQSPLSAGAAQVPRAIVRRHLYVGQSGLPDSSFRGRISRMQVWGIEVDPASTELLYETEVDSALRQFTHWYCNDVSVWSFGSLACYAAAAEKDPRFAADLLVRVDVHQELDGYDDFCCQALSRHGLSLTLGGSGRSWCRSGGGWRPVDAGCSVLDDAERRASAPWASGPACGSDRAFRSGGDAVLGMAWCRSRRLPTRRRPRAHCHRSRADRATSCGGGKRFAARESARAGADDDAEEDELEALTRMHASRQRAPARPGGGLAPGRGSLRQGAGGRAPQPSRVRFKQEPEEEQAWDALSSEPSADEEAPPPLVRRSAAREPAQRAAECRPPEAAECRPQMDAPRCCRCQRPRPPPRSGRCLPPERGGRLGKPEPCRPSDPSKRGPPQRPSRLAPSAPEDAIGEDDGDLPSLEELLADLDGDEPEDGDGLPKV